MRHEWTDTNDNRVAVEGNGDEPHLLRYFMIWNQNEGFQPVSDQDISWGAEVLHLARELDLAKRSTPARVAEALNDRIAALEAENQRLREERKDLVLACRGCGQVLKPRGEVTVSPEHLGTVIYVAPGHACD